MMDIALALSGGGFRASVFHLGVIARLARDNQLENVTFLSTVSGGSLVAGLIFTHGGNQWPGSQQYLEKVLPKMRWVFTQTDLQKSLIERISRNLFILFGSRADDLSRLIQKDWGVNITLNKLPERPRWMINATCYESGKNWRFERFRIGDYEFGYSYDTQEVKVADAMAASSGAPAVIGALELDISKMRWFKYVDTFRAVDEVKSSPDAIQGRKTRPITKLFSDKVHLWDGGVYDNHGLEGLHDFRTGWSNKFDFLIVSDAAGRADDEQYKPGAAALGRLMTGIMMTQIRSLRTRAIMERLENHDDKGVFLQTGNTTKYVLQNVEKTKWNQAFIEKLAQPGFIDQFSQGSLDDNQADTVARYPTVIRRLSDQDYDLLFRHGFEVADVTLCAYYPDQFQHIAFS
jgi:NTE family protein